jgi:uncharacterized protein (TIGR00255 family)
MLASMTGFGKGEASDGTCRATAEVRTVNSRYCDVAVRLPSFLSALETRLKEMAQDAMSRGRIEITVSFEGPGAGGGVPVLNLEVARAYRQGMSRMQEALGLDGTIDLRTLASMPDVFSYALSEVDLETARPLVEGAVRSALDRCNGMRRAEGDLLCRDFEERVRALERLLGEVEVLAPGRLTSARERLRERISQVIAKELDETRLATEIALLADRMDITEECVRFHSHNEQFLLSLRQPEPVGRRLNFLLQEMGREANTIGSKANDAAIAHLVVAMKEEIERLREQAQNVE